MRHDPQESFADAAAKCLNCLMLALLPDSRKAWGHALIAEQDAIAKGRERLKWAAGGILMTVNEFVRTLFSDRPTWAVGLTLGITSALIDLRSSTRWPYVVLLCTSGVVLAFWRPKWAWRWPLLLGLSLPSVVLVTNNWGAYVVDRFDVFYGLVPSALGAISGLLLRKLPAWFQHGTAGH